MKLYKILFSLFIIGNMHAAKLEKMHDLFEKDDFSQWTNFRGKPVGSGWMIKNGVIHRKSLSGDIITKEKFKDFELKIITNEDNKIYKLVYGVKEISKASEICDYSKTIKIDCYVKKK